MADTSKKMAAALAAVNAYMQEEEALAQQEKEVRVDRQPPPQLSPWGLSGRQHMMSMRQLLQMKAFSRL
ncbi:MAG: hypothetical protein ABR512_09005 [Desulfopila sp.]